MSDESLLIVSPECWRDACFSLPATRALARVRPTDILCPEPQRRLWEASGVSQVLTHDGSKKSLAESLTGIQHVLLWEDGVVAKACVKAAIPDRIGLPAPGLAKKLTRSLERTVRPGPPEHDVRRFLDTAATLGAEPFQQENFAALEIEGERYPDKVLIVADSDFGKNHEWPAGRWIELLEELPKHLLVLASGPLARKVAEATGIEVLEISDPIEAARFGQLIGADGSMPHVAAAFGTTCAVLYGPGDPDLIRPLGKQHSIIRRKVECSPCFVSSCPLDLRCQEDLSVGRVSNLLRGFIPA
ncbi:ADP-heptose--Lpsheptosyl transferase protein [Haloferula helveola]|uniref:ADP-heptose--Lpsheptosyl transferase protein n=1 Tax=Haloferula helveola TaxID=490095 RepID=A0ABN6H4H8_9BACT|nr:ADP-heptose--Lpsheptosyl transferase protein [Haloferula helveola]